MMIININLRSCVRIQRKEWVFIRNVTHGTFASMDTATTYITTCITIAVYCMRCCYVDNNDNEYLIMRPGGAHVYTITGYSHNNHAYFDDEQRTYIKTKPFQQLSHHLGHLCQHQ